MIVIMIILFNIEHQAHMRSFVFKKFITYAHKCDPGSRGSQVNLTPRRARVTRKGKSEIKTGLRNGQVCGKTKENKRKHELYAKSMCCRQI